MLYSVCKVLSNNNSGSGVFITENRVLTAYHTLVDCITTIGTRTSKKEIRQPITCEIFDEKTSVLKQAKILAYDTNSDIALLEVNDYKHPYVSKIITKSLISQCSLFDEVFVIGSSLGHEPLPTQGIITFIKDPASWMTSAPILVGNSGGGVFKLIKDSYYLIGIVTSMFIDDSTDNITHLTNFVPPALIHQFMQIVKEEDNTSS